MDITDGHAFPQKVEIDLDMLRALAGGVEGAVWGTTKVVGAALGVDKVGKAGDEGVAWVLVVG
jgi:hypothetical protein